MINNELISKFQNDNIRKHVNNTLDYVGIALDFVYPNIENLENQFYYEISDDYPSREERPYTEGSLQISNLNTQKNISISQNNLIDYIYKSIDEKYQIILNKSSLDFQCLNPNDNYTLFENFIKDYEMIFNKLLLSVKNTNSNINIKFSNLFLRKINKIELNDKNIKLLNEDYLKELIFFTPQTSGRFYKEIHSDTTDSSNIIIRQGVIQKDCKSYIMYDYQIYKNIPKSESLYKPINDLKEFSNIIYNLYRHMVGENFIEKYLNKED